MIDIARGAPRRRRRPGSGGRCASRMRRWSRRRRLNRSAARFIAGAMRSGDVSCSVTREAAHRADRSDVAAHHAGADHVHAARLEIRRPSPVPSCAPAGRACGSGCAVVGWSNSDLYRTRRIVGRGAERIAVVLAPTCRGLRRVPDSARAGRVSPPASSPGWQQRTRNGPRNSFCKNTQFLRWPGASSVTMRAVFSRMRSGTRLRRRGPCAWRAARRRSCPVSSRSSAAAGPIELRQPLHAVPAAWHDAEHHLGKRQARLRVVERDAIACRRAPARGRRPCRSR